MAEWTTQLEVVDSYVGPQRGGRSGKSRCVHLYAHNMDYHVCTVWEEDFDRLPHGIGEQMKEAEILYGTAPTRERAREDDLLQYCPAFEIEVYVEPQPDGSIVRKKKLAQVLGSAGASDARAAQARGRTAGVPAEDVVNKEFNPIPHDEVYGQVVVIAAESGVKMRAVLEEAHAVITDFTIAHELEEVPVETQNYIVGLMWRDINDAYRVVRPHLTREAETEDWYADKASEAIANGDAENFVEDVAAAHSLIVGGDHAKLILKDIGATGIPKDETERVTLAIKAWLYVDLLSRYGYHKAKAKDIISRV